MLAGVIGCTTDYKHADIGFTQPALECEAMSSQTVMLDYCRWRYPANRYWVTSYSLNSL